MEPKAKAADHAEEQKAMERMMGPWDKAECPKCGAENLGLCEFICMGTDVEVFKATCKTCGTGFMCRLRINYALEVVPDEG